MHPIQSAAEQRTATADGAGADKAAVLRTGPLRSSVDIAVSTTGAADLVIEQRQPRPRDDAPRTRYDSADYGTGDYGGPETPPPREVDRFAYGSATNTVESVTVAAPVVRAYLTTNHDAVEVVGRGL